MIISPNTLRVGPNNRRSAGSDPPRSFPAALSAKMRHMKITALAGGIGGARFLQGVLAALPDAEITVICPDLDTVMYTLGNGISTERGWGRDVETFTVKDELAAYGVEPTWFGLGDKDIATHLVRTQSLQAGYSLSEVTAALCDRWQPGVRLIPMSDDRAETNVVIDDPSGARDDAGEPMQIAIHFQEWWIRHRASLPAHAFVVVGIDKARPAPGVLEAITDADLVLLPPSNPVVSIGTILQVPGVAAAIRETKAPVIGVSPIVGGAPVRGMADACLRALGIETSALAVAQHYGSRSRGGLVDGWLIDTTDAESVSAIEDLGILAKAVPLMMTDVEATRLMALEAVGLASAFTSSPA